VVDIAGGARRDPADNGAVCGVDDIDCVCVTGDALPTDPVGNDVDRGCCHKRIMAADNTFAQAAGESALRG
jgi:fructose-specific component phosphotransferase system IIB-like protein